MTTHRILTQRTLDRLALLLTERRDAAMETAQAFFDEACDAQATADVSDRLDPASPVGSATEESYLLADRAFDAAREADDALHRIADGTYGTCERCGSAIPCARLRALPAATMCVECAGRRNSPHMAPAVRIPA